MDTLSKITSIANYSDPEYIVLKNLKKLPVFSFEQDFDRWEWSFKSDVSRMIFEDRKRLDKAVDDETYDSIWRAQKCSDDIFTGKVSEFRLAALYCDAGVDIKTVTVRNIQPQDKHPLVQYVNEQLGGKTLVNKYFDFILDDKVFVEVKTLVDIYYTGYILDQPYYNGRAGIRQLIERKIKDVKRSAFESFSKYLIVNAAFVKYFPKNLSEEDPELYKLWKIKERNQREKKWDQTYNMMDASCQDICIYDLQKDKIVYINENSFLFKEINPGVYSELSSPKSYTITPRYSREEVMQMFSNIGR